MTTEAEAAMLREESGERREGGLNEGSELDYEFEPNDFFEEPFQAGEVPELKEDLNIVVSLENRINDLLYLAADIEKSNGMKQSFAMEAEKLLPGFAGVPIGYYSKTVTATRFKISLEEISKGIWMLIAAAAAAVIAIIAKVIHWVTGKKGNKSSGTTSTGPTSTPSNSGGGGNSGGGSTYQKTKPSKDIDEEIKVAEDLPETMAKANSDIHAANEVLHKAPVSIKQDDGKEVTINTMQDAIDRLFTDTERYSRAKKLLNSNDPIFYDIINDGPYSKRITSLGELFRSINGTLLIKLDAIDDIIRKDLGSFSPIEETKHTNFLTKLSAPLEFTQQGRTYTLEQINTEINSVKQEAMDKHTENKIVFDHLFSAMANAYKSKNINQILSDMKLAVDTIGLLETRVAKLQDVARDFAADGTPGANTQDVGSHIRSALFVLAKDITGFGMIAQHLKSYSANMEYLAREALGFSLEIVRKVSHEMKMNNQEIPPAWLKVLENLNGRLKAITGAYYKR